MSLIEVFTRFPDQEACIEHLEGIRFGRQAYCPLCGSVYVARKSDGDRVGRWNCYGCRSSFNVLSGTIFQGTKVPLQKWFLAVKLVLNARKGISSHQLARDLDLNRGTAYTMLMRIRFEMADWQNYVVLRGIVEADETYVGAAGGLRGRGTDKTAVIGAFQRQGPIIARVLENVTAEEIRCFIEDHVFEGSDFHTDGLNAYRMLRDTLKHHVVKRRQRRFVGSVHTNGIEGFWSIVKRSWFGTHHRVDKPNIDYYLAEICYRQSNRNKTNPFDFFIETCVEDRAL